MTQLGEMLKAAREERGLSLEDVEKAIHIRRSYLEALEENNIDQFPSPVVARGLIRNYAKYLDLDPIEALTLFDGNGVVPVKGQRLTANGIEFMNLSMTPRPLVNWDLILGLVLLLLVIGGGGYLTYSTVIQPGVTATPTQTAVAAGLSEDSALLLPTATPPPTNTPTPLPPTPTPTAVVYTGVNVELRIVQPSWVQILADDEKVFEGVLQANETRSWRGERRVAIRAGNGGGVEVTVNGVNRGLMGAEGQVVDQIWEKVDDPAQLTPQPTPTDSLALPEEPAPTETPESAEEPAPTSQP